jgi:hypothetical protein
VKNEDARSSSLGLDEEKCNSYLTIPHTNSSSDVEVGEKVRKPGEKSLLEVSGRKKQQLCKIGCKYTCPTNNSHVRLLE